jgi:cell wall-associated NlpC family hydrolase
MKNLLLISLFFIACSDTNSGNSYSANENDTTVQSDTTTQSLDLPRTTVERVKYSQEEKIIYTGNTTPAELLAYAQTLIGIPYKYGSIDPAAGFDCSGFITHVFNHFNINVPRSSIDFTNVKREVPVAEAKAGDIVLFTGTDSSIRDVGHMGIITSNDNSTVNFIHSTSGKANGVTITPMNKYYMGRFVKVLRIFPGND